jgi:hypothetical protein
MFQLYHGESYIQWNDDDACFILDWNVELDHNSPSSLEQQTADKHVAPLWHMILFLSQQVFALTSFQLHPLGLNQILSVYMVKIL